MKLEDQVCSLELSKKLKEIGVKQESLFYWLDNRDCDDKECEGCKNKIEIIQNIEGLENDNSLYSSFSVSELFEMLPACIDIRENEPFNYHWLYVQKRSMKNIQYIARYICDSISGEELLGGINTFRELPNQNDEKLTDCLAKMIIHLYEDIFNKIQNMGFKKTRERIY